MKTFYESPKAEIVKLDLDEELLGAETGVSGGDGEYIGGEEPEP